MTRDDPASSGDGRAVRGPGNWLRLLGVALAFFTVLPVPARLERQQDLARALALLPCVGALLGGLAAATAWLCRGQASPLVAGALTATVLAVASGGLHLDGLADVFDGLGGGRGDRQRALQIMRDPTIGAHGAAALVLCLALKVALLGEIAHAARFEALVAMPLGARVAAVWAAASLPYARSQGLGKAFHDAAGAREVAIAALSAASLAWALGCLGPFAVGLGAGVAFCAFLVHRLGGVTGDVHGAAIEIGEVAFLLAC